MILINQDQENYLEEINGKIIFRLLLDQFIFRRFIFKSKTISTSKKVYIIYWALKLKIFRKEIISKSQKRHLERKENLRLDLKTMNKKRLDLVVEQKSWIDFPYNLNQCIEDIYSPFQISQQRGLMGIRYYLDKGIK